MDSPYCKAEWGTALAEAISKKDDYFIPVRVAGISPEGLLKTRAYIDIYGLDENEAKEELLGGLIPTIRVHRSDFPGKNASNISMRKVPYPNTIIDSKEKKTMFKWVHISDLHFYSSDGTNAKSMKDELPKTLKEIQDVNALFITGDFRYAGSKITDVKEPVEYIKKLCESLNIKEEDVYCVPGNHDLDRSTERRYIVNGLVGVNGMGSGDYSPQNGTFGEGVLEVLTNGFSYFANIEKGLYGECKIGDNKKVHKLVKNEHCNILMLNTAITSASDNDRGSLLLGRDYLFEVLKEIDEEKPTIMLGHHGHSFFERGEVKAVQPLLSKKKIHLYLCGHEHNLVKESVWDNIEQFSAGCIWSWDSEKKATITRAGFYVGEMSDEYSVSMTDFEWRFEDDVWRKNKTDTFKIFENSKHEAKDLKIASDATRSKTIAGKKEQVAKCYDSKIKSLPDGIKPHPINFGLDGYLLLGARGREGIKYLWKSGGDRVESLAFNKRQNEPHDNPETQAHDENISAYTLSVSLGCQLRASNMHCRFCETGTRDFRGSLSAEEIALQGIFMALYDTDCKSFPEVRGHEREFAFMGQGEPGYNYVAIRRAILLIDCAMEYLGQKIYRYVISTCGIPEFIDPLIEDINRRVFKNRIGLHFSLHAVGNDRKVLMPIENVYGYKRFIKLCHEFYKTSKEIFGENEKIGVGVIAFQKFQPSFYPNTNAEDSNPITLTSDKLIAILSELDKDVFRIDLSEFNVAQTATKSSSKMSNEESKDLLECVRNCGFEAKLFSSFGIGKNAECGLLRSSCSAVELLGDGEKGGKTTLEKLDEAKKLLAYAIEKIDGGRN